ncbi:MAG: ATP-binding protein [Candidatus Delongbacteria bacterium]
MKIAIASGKGGTGKTFLATNLASYISENEPATLVDLDVEEPNSAIFIKGEKIRSEIKYKMIPSWDRTDCTLCGKCQDVCNFNAILKVRDAIMVFPELCHSCYACSELCPSSSLPMQQKEMGTLDHYKKDDLDFIESKLNIGEEQAVPLISQTNVYVDYHLNNSISIFDCPPGAACPAIESVKDADLVILVAEPTPFGFHDLKLIVSAMEKIKKKFVVVINKSGLGNNDTADFCNKKNIPVISRIPHYRKLAVSYAKGELVYNKFGFMATELKKIYSYIKETIK